MTMFKLYEKLSGEDFSFAYLDNFTENATAALIALQDARIKPDKSARRKIRYLVTECFQNIIRHTNPETKGLDKLFAVRSAGNYHSVVSINPIEKTKKNQLKTSIDSLKDLSEAELKQVYLDALQEEGHNQNGGAGLGLIEIARKTKRVPSYQFNDLNQDLTEFQFELEFHTDPTKKVRKPALSTDEFYDYLKKNRVLIMQKGQFTQKTVMSLFELLENSLRDSKDSVSVSQKLYLVIELLQNMSNYSLETDEGKAGIFQIKLNEKGQTVFETGNYLSNKLAQELGAYVKSLKELSKIELLKRYNTELRKGLSNDDRPNAGIGIMEILKLTNGSLDYEIVHIDNEKSFIALTATIE